MQGAVGFLKPVYYKFAKEHFGKNNCEHRLRLDRIIVVAMSLGYRFWPTLS